jgi:hypothetical protein
MIVERLDSLYALRNDIAHGGISALDEWHRLDGYERHYRSTPLADFAIARDGGDSGQ